MDPRSSTLPELISWAVVEFGDTEAIADGATRITYTELGELVDRTARAIVASGVEPGETIAVWAPNGWQWVVAALAACRAGAVLVPVNTRFKGAEAAYVLGKARVKLLFTVNGFLGTDYPAMLAAAGVDLPDLAEIVVIDGPASDGTTPLADFDGRGGAEHQPEVEARSAAVTHDDVGVVMFTSGTTGHPKGVMVRGGVIIEAFDPYADIMSVTRGDRYLLVNPYFHAFGFNSGIVVCLLRGATNVPVAVFDPVNVLETIQDERITVFPGPPALYQGLLNSPHLGDYDISSLRACVTGAATIPVEMVIAMRERLGFDTVMTAFGMTETSGLATYCRPGDPPELIATTSGRAIPGCELRIVDDAGDELPPGRAGELLIRGFQVMPGYLDDPEQTAEAIDADGWLHSGDIAVMDENGYIDITDRKKDMFINGGFNVYPAEIERVLLEHPGVGQVAVIGIPDERLGELGAAFVVPSPGGAPDLDELREWASERMANYKVPRRYRIVDSLPLNASNKVRKNELRELADELVAAAGGDGWG